jgi:uncharacterized membrane protein YdjX (TVP38/TMEM64 family)
MCWIVSAASIWRIGRTLLTFTSLAHSPTSISLLQIIPQNPHLLLLIRIAPYPYNLLNVILASSPCLTLRTYTSCTAVSLCKLVLHTWIGAGIHDLSESYGVGNGSGSSEEGSETGVDRDHHHPSHTHGESVVVQAEEAHRQQVKTYTTWAGIVLCVALFFYLTHLAKRALRKAQEEQEREQGMRGLGPVGNRDIGAERGREDEAFLVFQSGDGR